MASSLEPCDGSGNPIRWMRKFSRLNARLSPADFLTTFDSYLEGDAAGWADDDTEIKTMLSVEGVRNATDEDVERLCEIFQARFGQPSTSQHSSRRAEAPVSTHEPLQMDEGRPSKRQKTLPREQHNLSEDKTVAISLWGTHQQRADESVSQYGLRTRQIFAANLGTDRLASGDFLDKEDQENLEIVINAFISGLNDDSLRVDLAHYAGSKSAVKWSLSDVSLHAEFLDDTFTEGTDEQQNTDRQQTPCLGDHIVHVKSESVESDVSAVTQNDNPSTYPLTDNGTKFIDHADGYSGAALDSMHVASEPPNVADVQKSITPELRRDIPTSTIAEPHEHSESACDAIHAASEHPRAAHMHSSTSAESTNADPKATNADIETTRTVSESVGTIVQPHSNSSGPASTTHEVVDVCHEITRGASEATYNVADAADTSLSDTVSEADVSLDEPMEATLERDPNEAQFSSTSDQTKHTRAELPTRRSSAIDQKSRPGQLETYTNARMQVAQTQQVANTGRQRQVGTKKDQYKNFHRLEVRRQASEDSDYDPTDPESSDSDDGSYSNALSAGDKLVLSSPQLGAEPSQLRHLGEQYQVDFAMDLLSPMRSLLDILKRSRHMSKSKLHTTYKKRLCWSGESYCKMQGILHEARYPALSFLLLDLLDKEEDILSPANTKRIPEELVQSVRRIWYEDTKGGKAGSWMTRCVPKHFSKKIQDFTFGKWDRGLLMQLQQTDFKLFPINARTFEYWEIIMGYLIVINRAVFQIFETCHFEYQSKRIRAHNAGPSFFSAYGWLPHPLKNKMNRALRVSNLPTGATTGDLAKIFPNAIDIYLPYAQKKVPPYLRGCAVVVFSNTRIAQKAAYKVELQGQLELNSTRLGLQYCNPGVVPTGPLAWPEDLPDPA